MDMAMLAPNANIVLGSVLNSVFQLGYLGEMPACKTGERPARQAGIHPDFPETGAKSLAGLTGRVR